VPPCADIRGWREMYTLDAPAWTLFYEYIANVLYALFLRRASVRLLAVLAALCACATIYLAVFVQGDVYGGWEFSTEHLRAGFVRLLYPFLAGLLLCRLRRAMPVRGAFVWTALLLVAVICLPRWGGREQLWLNGLYESAVILILFPLIVWFGAAGAVGGGLRRLCRLLGGVSYPLYLVNYPIVYVYSAWITQTRTALSAAVWQSAAVFLLICAVSYLAYRFYEQPLQRLLRRRFLTIKS
jgi:peptidoglycan/LPS O-acetylase OafA/YrhL